MLSVDVNILVYAHRPESPNHEGHRAWLEAARHGIEPLGIPPVVASGFLRIVTHPRVFNDPSPLAVALDFIDSLHSSPTVIPMSPGDRHWAIFTEMCRRLDAIGNTIPDLFLAAMAIEQGATWVSADRGFAGVPGLRWIHPLDG